MTDTTDTKALREECAQWVKDTIGEAVDTRMALNGDGNDYMSWDMSVIWLAWLHLSGKLEAERQRADDAHKYGSERDSENESLMLTVGRLRVEIAELKGEQEPVALIDGRQGSRGFCLTQHGQRLNLPHGTELFTAPQKPIVLPGISELIDACDSTPAVRDVHVWDLAISEVKRLNPSLFSDKSAAGGIVKDGE